MNKRLINIKTIIISIAVYTVLFAAFYLFIMPSDAGNLGGKHAWISGSTIKFVNMWLEEGASNLHFVNYEAFPSIELETMADREPYVSYPTGETFMVWSAAKIAGKAHINISFLKHYQLLLYGIENIMLLLLIYVCLSKTTSISEISKSVIAVVITTLWTTFPINNWFMTNIFWTDIAVIFWVIAFWLLEYVGALEEVNKKLRRVIKILKILVIYAGVMTEYYFCIVVFLAFLANVVRTILTTGEKKVKACIRDNIHYVIPVVLGVGTFIWQVSCVDGWFDKLIGTFFLRTGSTGEVEAVWPMLLKNMSVALVWGSRKRAIALLTVEIAFLIVSILVIYRRIGIKKFLVDRSISIVFLMYISPIIQILMFSNHSAIHQYAMTKLSLQVIACILGLIIICIKYFCDCKIRSVNVAYVSSLVIVLMTLFALGYPKRVTGLYMENYKKADYALAEVIRDQTSYNDVCFSLSYSIPLMPPMDVCVSEKQVYTIDSVEETYSMFPDLPQEANMLLIIDKTGKAGNIYDKKEKDAEIEDTEKNLLSTHEIVFENEFCAIVDLER